MAAMVNAPPKSGLGGAVGYLLNNRLYLSRYIDHGELK